MKHSHRDAFSSPSAECYDNGENPAIISGPPEVNYVSPTITVEEKDLTQPPQWDISRGAAHHGELTWSGTNIYFRYDFDELDDPANVHIDTIEMLNKNGFIAANLQVEHDCISGIITRIARDAIVIDERLITAKPLIDQFPMEQKLVKLKSPALQWRDDQAHWGKLSVVEGQIVFQYDFPPALSKDDIAFGCHVMLNQHGYHCDDLLAETGRVSGVVTRAQPRAIPFDEKTTSEVWGPSPALAFIEQDDFNQTMEGGSYRGPKEPAPMKIPDPPYIPLTTTDTVGEPNLPAHCIALRATVDGKERILWLKKELYDQIAEVARTQPTDADPKPPTL